MISWQLRPFCHIARLLCEYQKMNSSALPAIFISFKTINEQINFRRQQLSRDVLKIEIE